MGTTYWYHISYDEIRDDFTGLVDFGPNTKSEPIYTIDTTQEMCEYIKTGVMKHIDDVDGLSKFLIEQGIINKEDTILLSEVPLW